MHREDKKTGLLTMKEQAQKEREEAQKGGDKENDIENDIKQDQAVTDLKEILIDADQLLRHAPTTPGIYMMKDREGQIIYVGKAKS